MNKSVFSVVWPLWLSALLLLNVSCREPEDSVHEELPPALSRSTTIQLPQGKLWQLTISRENLGRDTLVIYANGLLSFYLNNRYLETDDTLALVQADLLGHGSGEAALTIWADSDNISWGAAYPSGFNSTDLKKEVEAAVPFRSYRNFINTGVVLLLVLGAVLRVNLGKEASEYTRLSFLFSGRNRDENLFRNKITSQSTVLVSVYYILLLSYTVVLWQQQLGIPFDGFGDYLITWGKWTIIFLFLLVAKVFLIMLFNYIYRIENFFQFHFFNYLRFSLLWVIIGVVILSFLNWFRFPEPFLTFLVVFLITGYILRSLILTAKVLNISGFTYLHLFSYLCATELFPFFWLLLMSGYILT